ncbi:polysaccharide pyruvyl transferase family protein [Maricaulis parjimensis]|uniref:polysaccharide pyruvyl transferase family protein n=1 Tax=Maricaulis parjimensis TaxID=144023 RepID=UPI001939F376|nr:polysaccharide pyruvyl transferase family protein [Maricaulis parjimensis]
MIRESKIALLGYYGRHNFGDDLMIRALCDQLRGPQQTLRVFSGAPYLARQLGPDIQTVPRSLKQIIASLFWCKEFVMAGGTIFHDSYRADIRKAYVKHLWAYAGLLCLARLLGKRVRMVGVGIGPLQSRAAQRPTRLALRAAHRIHVRDQASADEVLRLAPDAAGKLVVGSDLAFLAREGLRNAGSTVTPDNRLGLSVLDMAQFLDNAPAATFWDGLIEAVGAAMTSDPSLELALFCYWTAPGRPNDIEIAEGFAARLPEACRDRVKIIAYDGDVDRLVTETAACRGMIATRFHAAVIAWLIGRPTAIVSYNRKVTDFADQIGLPAELRLSGNMPIATEAAQTALEALLAARPEASAPSPDRADLFRTAFEEA